MASIVVDDPSIGEALGTLAKGFGVASDPKRRAEAMYLQQRIYKAQQEAEDAQALQQSRNQLADEFAKVQQYQRSQIAPEISPEPMGGQMGPLMPVPNPRLGAFDANAGFAREALRTGMLSATSAQDALKGAYYGRGQGQLATSGLPIGEEANRVLATQIKGELPDANAAYTDSRRRMLANEANDLEIRKSLAGGIKIGQNETFIPSPQQQETFQMRPGFMQGQISVGPKETVRRPDGTVLYGAELPQGGAPGTNPLDYPGSAVGGVSRNKLRAYAMKARSGQGLTQEEYVDYINARDEAYPKRIEYRQVGNDTVPVLIETPVPPELQIAPPGGNAAGGPPAAVGGLAAAPPAPDPGSAAGGVPAPVSGGIAPEPFLTAPSPGGAAPAPAVPSTPPAPVRTGAGGLPILSPDKTSYTEAQGKDLGYAARMMQGDDELANIEAKGTMPSISGAIGAEITDRVVGGLTPTGAEALQEKIAPGYGVYATASQQFLSAILRKDSGAAVPLSEYPQYYAMFIPRPSDSDDRKEQKALARAIAVRTMQQIGEGFRPEQIFNSVATAIAQGGGRLRRPAPAAPAGGRDYSDVDAIVGLGGR